jgi:hypothetical protein
MIVRFRDLVRTVVTSPIKMSLSGASVSGNQLPKVGLSAGSLMLTAGTVDCASSSVADFDVPFPNDIG